MPESIWESNPQNESSILRGAEERKKRMRINHTHTHDARSLHRPEIYLEVLIAVIYYLSFISRSHSIHLSLASITLSLASITL
jgi:hypothetical protein